MAAKLTNELAGLSSGCDIKRCVHEDGIYQFFIDYPKVNPLCPSCGSAHCNIKTSDKEQVLRHIAINRQPSFLVFKKKRYCCVDCGVSFYSVPDWMSLGIRMTQQLYFSIVFDLMTDKSIHQIALDNGVTDSITSTLLENLPVSSPRRLPETLCIDEFKGDSGVWNSEKHKYDRDKFQTIIVDGDDYCVIDVLPGKKSDDVKEWVRKFSLQQRQTVRYYCCDMYNGYVSVAKDLLPNAHICIDTFHVIEKLHDAMNAIRCAEENQAKEEGDTDRYQLFFRLRRTLTTDRLNAEMKWGSRKAYNEKRLKEAFNASPALSECYEMLQNFQAILHEEKHESRVLLLGNWINTYRESEHADIVHAVKTVIRWKGYILNAWRYGKSNGPAKGMNNNIKVKKRIAYGYHNFELLRKRILLRYGKIRRDQECVKILWSSLGSKKSGRNQAKL